MDFELFELIWESFTGELLDIGASVMDKGGIITFIDSMKYGIKQPLKKVKYELEEMGRNTSDHKSDKRRIRLDFVTSVIINKKIRKIFPFFMQILNGNGSHGSENGQYMKQLHIITMAGGNICILFAQLLKNMVDIYLNPGITNWDIDKSRLEHYTSSIETLEKFDDISRRKNFEKLTETNKKILKKLSEADDDDEDDEDDDDDEDQDKMEEKEEDEEEKKEETPENIWEEIVIFFKKNKEAYTAMCSVAHEEHSDIDCKLSINAHPDKLGYHIPSPSTDSDMKTEPDDEADKRDVGERKRRSDSSARGVEIPSIKDLEISLKNDPRRQSEGKNFANFRGKSFVSYQKSIDRAREQMIRNGRVRCSER